MPVFSACTKLIIAGEHLVLYGFRALAIPFPKLTIVQVEPSDSLTFEYDGIKPKPYISRYIEREIKNIASDLNIEPNFHFKITFQAEPGIGLGVSASLAIALIKAMTSNKIADDQILRLTMLSEVRNHGKVSGIDHITIFNEKPFILNSDIKIKNSKLFNQIEILNTGKPNESTKQMIDFVSQKIDLEQCAEVDKTFDALVLAIQNNDKAKFIDSINVYGKFLEDLGIVTDKAKQLSGEYRAKGYGVKICGAGGLTGGSGIMMLVKP